MFGSGGGRRRAGGEGRARRLRIWFAAAAVVLPGGATLAAQMTRTQLWEDRAVHAGWRLQTHVWSGRCRLLDRDGGVRASGRGGHCAEALAQARRDAGLRPAGDRLVLLLDGLGRSPRLFRPMARALRAAGYEAAVISYPSLTKDIAGGARGDTGFNPLLSADNDGVVTVAETRLAGARDFLIVAAPHTVIAGDPAAIAATLRFLETGGFR